MGAAFGGACFFCKNRKPAYYRYMIKKKGEKEMVKYILMPEETIQKIRKGDKQHDKRRKNAEKKRCR